MKFRKQCTFLIFLLIFLLSVFVSNLQQAKTGSTPYDLVLNGLVDHPLNFTYSELQKFPMISEVAPVQCVGGWTELYNWTGIPLFFLLSMTGIKTNATEVVFYAKDGFSSSISIEKAMHPATLLALQANGSVLSDYNGYPYRLVVPCKYGYKWVKWVTKIEVVDYDYKGTYESYGFSDEADIPDCILPSTIPPYKTFHIVVGSRNYSTIVLSNSTISYFDFDIMRKQICFNVNGATGTIGYCYVSIPKGLLWCDTPEQWQVWVNDTSIEDRKVMENANYTCIYFNYNHSIQEVKVEGVHTALLYELGSYPIVDFAVYNVKLYAAAGSTLYTYDGSSWGVIDAPSYVTSLEPFEGKLIVGGQGGLYSYDGTSFNLIFTVPTYIKVLGVYNNTLYAGTFLGKPPILYYCNDSAENPSNWHVDAGFSALLNFSGSFGSIDSFAEYNSNLYVTSGGTAYCYNETGWSIVKTLDDVYGVSCMTVYNGKLYLATRDQGWRKPLYQGGTGFSGRVIEYDGENWTTTLDHDYWIFALETYNGKLYAGTANKIYAYNGKDWDMPFNAPEGAYYAISFIIFNNKLYAGMGNGYIFVDPLPERADSEAVVIPEFSSSFVLPTVMIAMLLALILYRRKHYA